MRRGVVTAYPVALTTFACLQSSQGVPQMMVVSDLEDVFVPIVEGVLVSVEEAQQSIDRYSGGRGRRGEGM